jgi:hypothetical protein
LEENPSDWLFSTETGKIADVIPGFKYNPEYFPPKQVTQAETDTTSSSVTETMPVSFEQAPAAIIAVVDDKLVEMALPLPKSRSKKPASVKEFKPEAGTLEQKIFEGNEYERAAITISRIEDRIKLLAGYVLPKRKAYAEYWIPRLQAEIERIKAE